METFFMTLVNSFLENGPMGLLALIGWTLSAVMLKKDFKKKDDENSQVLEAKNQLIEFVQKSADERITDAKENQEDYGKLATSTVQTLDRLTAALEIRNER
jgi:cystathionine beta-lyase/cystathionine gamma-synthase